MKVPMVQNNDNFLKIQSLIIANYLNNQQKAGDERSENDIVLEWIKHNSKRFREVWIATEGNLG